jgi:outer membrane protein assembly factor BamB
MRPSGAPLRRSYYLPLGIFGIGALMVLILALPVLAQARGRLHVQPGHLVLSYRQSEEECQLMLNGRRGYIPFKPASPSNLSLGGTTLLAGHKLLMACGRSGLLRVGAVDLGSSAIIWQRRMLSADIYTASNRFLFQISRHQSPASGFHAKKLGLLNLTAISTKTGKVAWSMPYPNGDGEFNEQAEAVESPSGPAGAPAGVVLFYQGMSAFDAHGKLLWHRDSSAYEGEGVYAGLGQILTGAIGGEEVEDGSQTIKAVDPLTGAIHWETPLPQPCFSQQLKTAGAAAFEFGPDCTVEFNLETGALGHDVRYPSSWNSVAPDASAAASFDGSNLALYALGDLSQPIWSRHVNAARPLLLTPEHLLVRAPGGVLLLDASDGKTVARVPEADMWSPEVQGPVEGMIASVDGNGVPVVLRVDRH